jgi:hypothetical protein
MPSSVKLMKQKNPLGNLEQRKRQHETEKAQNINASWICAKFLLEFSQRIKQLSDYRVPIDGSMELREKFQSYVQ